MTAPALAALALLLSADPAPKTPAKAPASPGACTAACCGKLWGAVTAEFECTVDASADPKRVLFVVSGAGQVAGVKAFVPARFEIPAPLEGRAYTLATLGEGGARVELEGGGTYVASGARGEVTLEVDGLERYPSPRDRYRVVGTLRARLVPATAAGTGEVHLEVRF